MPSLPTELEASQVHLPTPALVPNFVDGENLSSQIAPPNSTFTTANVPNPLTSLHVYWNGVRQSASNDYAPNAPAAGAAFSFTMIAIPQPGDVLTVDYRH
jgi:hypothetical protein